MTKDKKPETKKKNKKDGQGKPGGQPGNKNALKHGLYAKRINKDEMEVLDGLSPIELLGEINYQRALNARIAELIEKKGLTSGADAEKLWADKQIFAWLNALNNGHITLLTYMRTHALLHGGMQDIERLIEEGLFLARENYGIHGYHNES